MTFHRGDPFERLHRQTAPTWSISGKSVAAKLMRLRKQSSIVDDLSLISLGIRVVDDAVVKRQRAYGGCLGVC